MVYKFFDKKSSGSRFKSEIMSNPELAGKLHKPIIKKFEKRKVYLSFKESIWGGDLADMQLISKLIKIKEFDFYYAYLILTVNMHWLFPWKIKEGITITKAFQEIYKNK